MIYLLFILLIFGLFQSLLELAQKDAKESKWRIKKILSLLYIGGFLTAVVVTVIQEKESYKVKESIQGILSSVTEIHSALVEQLRSMSKMLEQTQSLINKSDSTGKRMMKVLETADSLTSQYEEVNTKLSKQVELETKQFEERSPTIELMDWDISWQGNDSTSYYIEACIRNYGKRNALINGGRGYVLFFDKNNRPLSCLNIPGNNNKEVLEPNETEKARLCYISDWYGIKDYRLIKSRAGFGVICLKVNYEDIVMGKDSVVSFYSGWVPDHPGFWGLNDWQIGLARAWAAENLKFDEKKW